MLAFYPLSYTYLMINVILFDIIFPQNSHFDHGVLPPGLLCPEDHEVGGEAGGGAGPGEQSGALSLVQIIPDTLLSLVDKHIKTFFKP